MGAAVIAPKSAGSSVYSASKAAVNSLVETAAIENAPHVRINAVLPGVVRTNIINVDDDSYQKIGASMQPLYGRAGQSMEIASLVSYLLSSEASFMSGTMVRTDGLWALSGGTFDL
jgi:NAD(P)-dependent dehydrogenase (short-subunit alcohol dehydrogenase family)